MLPLYAPNTENIGDASVLEDFMPWSDKVPTHCRMTQECTNAVRQTEDDPIVDIDAEALDQD